MPHRPLPQAVKRLAAALLALLVTGCVFRIDVQQGNVVEQESLEEVEVGMTRSQVQFLLGTPMVNDPFHSDRWDYPYYLRRGRADEAEKRWFAVYFDGDRVTRLERDLELQPAPPD